MTSCRAYPRLRPIPWDIMQVSIRQSVPMLALLALSSMAAAQEAAWETYYDDPLGPGLVPVALEGSPDGGVVVAGIARSFPLDEIDSGADLVVQKFSANGDPLWRVTRPATVPASWVFYPSLVDVDVDSEGSVFVVEPRDNASRLLKIRFDGTLDWTIPIGMPGTDRHAITLYQVDASVPNEIVVSGGHLASGFYPHLQLQSYDSSGALRFSVPSGTGDLSPQILLRSTKRSQGGTTYSLGPGDTTGNLGRVSRVVAHDSNGNLLWANFMGSTATGTRTTVRDLDWSPAGVTTALANQEVSATQPNILMLTRYSNTGVEMFDVRYAPAPNLDVNGNSIAVLPNGGFVVAASMQRSASSPNNSFVLLWFDDQGMETGLSFIPSAGTTDEGAAQKAMVDVDGNVLALGWSEHPASETILASYSQAGTLNWTRRIHGIRPSPTFTLSSGVRLAEDTSGNLLSLTQDAVSGIYPTQDQALTVRKTMRGGLVGTHYCSQVVPNSTGLPAEIVALGQGEASIGNMTLAASDLPAGTTTLFLASQIPSILTNVGGGQGTLCLGGSIGRFVGPGQLRQASPSGHASLAVDLGSLPQPTGLVPALAGETWRFQAWYRDLNPTATSNLTGGVAVLWR